MKQIDSLGRIVIPKELRERNGYKTNDLFEIYERGDEIILKPMKLNYSISDSQMLVLRKLFLMVKDIDLLEDSELNILKETCKCTDMTCPTCKEPLFINADNTYKCMKCGE